MAAVVIDEHKEYVWQVSDMVLGRVLDDVMRRIDSTTAFHELLHIAKTYGNLEFFRLGDQQRDQFESLVTSFYEQQVQDNSEALSEDDLKQVKRLLDLIGFAKTLQPS